MTPTDKRRRRARIANAARERERITALTVIALAAKRLDAKEKRS